MLIDYLMYRIHATMYITTYHGGCIPFNHTWNWEGETAWHYYSHTFLSSLCVHRQLCHSFIFNRKYLPLVSAGVTASIDLLLRHRCLDSGHYCSSCCSPWLLWQFPRMGPWQNDPITLIACVFFINSATLWLSLTLPRCLWHPKNFSKGSWQSRWLKKELTPGTVKKYLMISTNNLPENNNKQITTESTRNNTLTSHFCTIRCLST